MRKRVFFYVQHLLGIGHLRRAAAIARALVAAGAEVTFVSGGEPVPGIDLGGAELVQLPPASAADSGFSAIVDAAGRPVDALVLLAIHAVASRLARRGAAKGRDVT